MAWIRQRRGKNGAINYSLLESYRDGGKWPKHRTLKSWTVGGPVGEAAAVLGSKLIESQLLAAPALPFMIAHDLITGSRVAALKEHLASKPAPSTEPPNYHITRANISFPSTAHPVTPIDKPLNTLDLAHHKAAPELAPAAEPMRDEYGSKYSQADKEIEAREQAFEKNQDDYTADANAKDAAAGPSEGPSEGEAEGGE